jgi:hypothetical protein
MPNAHIALVGDAAVPVVVDLVTATAGLVMGCPHSQCLAVIDADQASPLWDQTGAASWGVIDIFGNLRCDLSGKIRADACDESGRNAVTRV